MDYCLDGGDGTASIWTSAPDIDLDGDGVFDAVRIDLNGDGVFDDALGDLDGDGSADHAALGLDADSRALYTDDGTGTWMLAGGIPGGSTRWFALDGTEHDGPPADIDGDGRTETLLDVNRDGLADRALADGGRQGYVDTDGDGCWDLLLLDSDGDGAADAVSSV